VPDDLIIDYHRPCRFVTCRGGFIEDARRKSEVENVKFNPPLHKATAENN